nr:glycosyltransferase family 2 protein [Pyrococcus sp. NA2]
MKVDLFLLLLVFAWDSYFFFRYILGLLKGYKTREWQPTVSVIIPAYNEEENIESSVRSVLSQDYPVKEVIVVDDGSSDGTYERARRINDPRLRVIRIEHSGKTKALNEGIKASSGEIIVTTDADSVMEKNAVRRLIERFYSDDVVAVGGQVRVMIESPLTLVQDVEHLRIAMYRRGKDLDDLSLAPGPISAFRRDALERIGGIQESPVEDYATTKAIKRVGRVVYAPKAKVYTRMPMTLTDLWRQRKRWFLGDLRHLNLREAIILALSDFIALLDVALPVAFLLTGKFSLLFLFLGFEYLTMLVPFLVEGGRLIELLLFPFILWFLALFYLSVHLYGYVKLLKQKI